ncbi:MAG: division/cell wall cluster transcriptional repressor MraZ [Vallitaleaceae bacterium]|nr:division/cell wall cluster transcriptional repressor MraZ [Vallitaleaceae bacterium]
MFSGEFSHSIDEKGRITMPAKFRKDLGEECVVARGFEGCLNVYSMEEWEKVAGALAASNQYSQEIRLMQRAVIATAMVCTYDKQGRILISSELRKRGKLDKDVMVVGVGTRIELWDKDAWDAFNEISDDDLSALAAKIMVG